MNARVPNWLVQVRGHGERWQTVARWTGDTGERAMRHAAALASLVHDDEHRCLVHPYVRVTRAGDIVYDPRQTAVTP